MITTVCKISYGSQTVPPIVPAVQGDTGRAISFEIADFTPPAGATATYFILKPSGEAIYNSATITDNSILCELTAQSLAEAGENRMQVRVIQGEDIVTSFEVILMVRTFLGDDAIESGTEMNIFDQAVAAATEQFQENAEQIVEEVIESIPEDYTELTEEVEQLNERIGNLSDLETEDKTDIVSAINEAARSGITDEVKVALLACFEKAAWTDENGRDYYDALEAALYSEHPQEVINVILRKAFGPQAIYDSEGVITDDFVLHPNPDVAARCGFDVPITNRHSAICVVDKTKYNIATYNLSTNELQEYRVSDDPEAEKSWGYLLESPYSPVVWSDLTSIVTGKYFVSAFKKLDGTDFTTDEINNAEGTVFVVGKQSDVVAWDGTGTSQKWVDENNIIGIDDPKKFSFISGYSISGGILDDAAVPAITAKRAASLSQALVGDFDGKKLSLKSYTLSTGAQINYALWYGYLMQNNTYKGSQYVSEDNAYTARQWLSAEVTLPIDAQKSGKRVILLAFKITNADREFTQAELREIPTLITIS